MAKRILLVHNRYQQAGGEDAVVANEKALLAAHGYETRLWSVSNDEIRGLGKTLMTAWQSTYSYGSRRRMREIVAAFGPDLVHVHNFFPLLSPSIYDSCAESGVPVVQSLHNYRIICPGGLLMRDGRPCEDCIDGTPYQAALHGCYRGSRLGSLAVARMVRVHQCNCTWNSKVDRFIALSEFARGRFVAAGLPAERIAVKPNFAEDRRVSGPVTRAGALYVGRLSPEKGIATLLRAWSTLEVPLRVIGDGPLAGAVVAASGGRIASLGFQSGLQVAEEMAGAAFMVLPSQCYENFPLTIAEAFCQGLPVIASRIGALEELVEDGVTGLHFTPGNAADLRAKVSWAHEHPEVLIHMGREARARYLARYSPEVNFRIMTEIYDSILSKAALGVRNRRASPLTVNEPDPSVRGSSQAHR
jgi:glycosyltransferase involved in cell wall biosynthesis